VPKGGGGGDFVTETVLYVTANPATPTIITAPPPLTMRLRSQQTAIRGVSVDAEFCPGTVSVYAGVSAAQGTPVVVQPGSARAFGIEGSSAIYVVFGLGNANGYARITAYAVPTEAFGIATGAPALQLAMKNVDKRLEKVVDVLQAILAKLP
jgi:hypothetical protein